jgi:hypothetical protein
MMNYFHPLKNVYNYFTNCLISSYIISNLRKKSQQAANAMMSNHFNPNKEMAISPDFIQQNVSYCV